jgi:acyl-coenzyme A synthetase/AMP-(fatty) acid ligase
MPGAQWFPGVSMNYVDQVFRHATAARPAIVSRNEAGVDRELSWAELQRQVGALAASLRAMGVQRGDRVVAYLPNIPETASPSSPWPASARSGRPARPTWGALRYSTASARSRPRC